MKIQKTLCYGEPKVEGRIDGCPAVVLGIYTDDRGITMIRLLYGTIGRILERGQWRDTKPDDEWESHPDKLQQTLDQLVNPLMGVRDATGDRWWNGSEYINCQIP